FDGAHEGIANFHLLFLMRLSFYMGIGPNLSEGLEQSKYFDLDEGKFVPFVPAHSHYLSESDSFHLLQMFRLDYKTMHLYKMSRQERNHSVEVMIEYYRLHIPGFPELKSLSVLQELFC
ncbi:DNA repair protein RecO, partial [Segatella hominis]